MYTSNNKNALELIYNGPHEIRSTFNMGYSITIRNVSFEKEYREIKKEDIFVIKNNIQNHEIYDENI